jgi:hypothetical protein
MRRPGPAVASPGLKWPQPSPAMACVPYAGARPFPRLHRNRTICARLSCAPSHWLIAPYSAGPHTGPRARSRPETGAGLRPERRYPPIGTPSAGPRWATAAFQNWTLWSGPCPPAVRPRPSTGRSKSRASLRARRAPPRDGVGGPRTERQAERSADVIVSRCARQLGRDLFKTEFTISRRSWTPSVA